jgi:hypothetical protein
MTKSRCLCGAVRWTAEGPLQFMSHCHCSRCRKAHGTPFATYVAAPADSFTLTGAEHVTRYESSPGFFRPFCNHCGSVTPGDAWEGLVFLPAGCMEDDPAERPGAHIFVASKARWYEIPDALPQFEAYPAGVGTPEQPDLTLPDPPGKFTRGSCLCGSVAYVVEEKPFMARYCHCSRCRQARGAAHASNMLTRVEGVRFTRGADLVASYKLPEAKFFTQAFCRRCGSAMPRLDTGRNIAIVPMGSLDDDPGIRPSEHIFAESKAPWFEIADGLTQHPGPPPTA